MTATTSRVAAAVGVAVTAIVLTAPTASGETLGVGWEGEMSGYQASGEQLRVPVTFSYTGSPGSVISTITLELVPGRTGRTDSRCSSRTYIQSIADGDGGGDGQPPTTPDAPDPTIDPDDADEEATVTSEWTFSVDPGCNGTYDLEVYAVADPGGPAQPGDPGTRSAALVAEDVRLALVPPPPTGVEAVLGADRSVTVSWTAPATWTDDDGPPADAEGFVVERAGSDGQFVVVAEPDPDETSVLDPDLAGAPDGTYRYRVVATRFGATSAPAESSVVLAPPTTTTTPTTAGPAAPAAGGSAGGSSGVGRGSVGRGASAAVPSPTVPTTEFDPGFAPELDYDEFEEGEEEAIVPADASLLEVVVDDPVGAGLLVPGAVALCLAVWAGHLHHLSRRAAQPY